MINSHAKPLQDVQEIAHSVGQQGSMRGISFIGETTGMNFIQDRIAYFDALASCICRIRALQLQGVSALFLLPLAMMLWSMNALGQGFQMTELVVPGAQSASTFPLGVNVSGSVVGFYTNSSGALEGFLYSAGTYTAISYPGATAYTRASGINDSGIVVGDYQINGDDIIHSYTYSAGTYTPYNDYKGLSTTLSGINNAGDKVGSVGGNGVVEGYIDIGGQFTTFYANGTDATYALAINASQEVVGQFFDSSGNYHGFSRTASGVITQIDYPGALETVTYGINDSGEITGTYINSSGLPYGFTYIGGKFATTDFAGTRGVNSKGAYDGFYWGVDGVAQAYLAVPQTFKLTGAKIPKSQQGSLNAVNKGQVGVGSYVDSTGKEHGLMATLTTLKNIDDPKGVTTVCLGINSSNVIVGDYFDTSGNPHGFEYSGGVFTDIPGPSGALSSDATGINDTGEISGDFYSGSDGLHHGFVLKSGIYTQLDVPGAVETFGGGINASAQITFFWVDFAGYVQSSLYNGTNYTTIDVPGAASTYAQGINTAGDIVFFWFDPYGVAHSALKKGNAYYVFDFPNGSGTIARGINDSNLLVGSYDPAGQSVPELYYGTE